MRRAPRIAVAVAACAAASAAACQVPDVTFAVANDDCVLSPVFRIETNPLGPSALAVGDVNADGRPDVAVTGRGGDTLSVLFGSATAAHAGEFDPRVDFLVGAQPSAVTLGDVNGDGKLDAIVGNAGDATLSVLLGRGDGSFDTQRTVPSVASAVSLVAADLDGDSKLDVAVLSDSGDVGVLLGNGDGTFRRAVDYPVGDGAQQILTADVDGNRVPDLVVLRTPAAGGGVPDGDSAATLLIGRGDGTFQAAVDRDVGPAATWLAAADLSGDGATDLAVARRGSVAPSKVGILLGSGDGQFAPAGDVIVDRGPVTVALADMNGDGKLDLVVNVLHTPRLMARGGAVDVLLGNGDGTFQDKVDTYGSSDPVGFAVADLNGDHVPDVVLLSDSDAMVSAIAGKGDGTLPTRADYLLGTGPASAAFGDVTDDGQTDAVVADQTNTAVAIDVVGSDGFIARVEAPTRGTPVAPLIADLDGDGAPDIVAAGVDRNSLTVALRSRQLGPGHSLIARTFDLDTAAAPVAVAAGDLDRDGKLDLVVAARDAGAVSVLLNRGGGDFAARVDYPVGEQPVAVAIADVGGGARGVVAANRAAATISVLVANPDGTLRSKVDYPTGPEPVALAVGDVTGDHIDDIIVANHAGRSVTMFAGNGDGTFRTGLELAAGAGPSSVAIVDINGDGPVDIVVANADGHSLSVFHGDGKGGLAAAIVYPEVDRPLAVAADPQGGGKIAVLLDSLTQNAKTAVAGICLK